MKLSSRSRGQIAVLKVQLRACEKEWLCNIPINNEIYYDLILDHFKTKEIVRVQIKYCNRRVSTNKNLELRLDNKRSKRIYYKDTDINWILVYVPKIDKILKYEKPHFHRKKSLTINLDKVDSPWHYSKFVW